MTFQKRNAFGKILALLAICTLIGSFTPLSYSAGESGYGDVLTEIYGSASVSYPHYIGSEVTANFGASCTNYYLVDAKCTYRFKIALIKLGGQWDVQLSSNETSGGGTAPGNNDPDEYENWYSASQALNASAVNLEKERSYRIETYSRLKVSVPGVGSEEWFSNPSVTFEP